MFQKILLPTDGSRHSEEAARFAAELAAHHQSVVQPVVAVEYQYVTSDEVPEAAATAIRERIQGRATQALARAAEILTAGGVQPAEGKILEGPPVDVILQAAEDDEYDLIVMGSRGVSLDEGHARLVGSVTEQVLHRTPCPVLVIRAEPKP